MTQLLFVVAALPIILNYYVFHNTSMNGWQLLVTFVIVFLSAYSAGVISGIKFIHSHVHSLVDHAIEEKRKELSHTEE